MVHRLASLLTRVFPSGFRAGFCPRSAPRLLRIAPKHSGTVCAATGGLGGGANGPISPDPGACKNPFCPPGASLIPDSLTTRGRGVIRMPPWVLPLTFNLQLPGPDLAGSRLLAVVPMFPSFLITHIPHCWDFPLPTLSLHEETYSAGSHSHESPIHSEAQPHIPNFLGFPTIDSHSLLFFWACSIH